MVDRGRTLFTVFLALLIYPEDNLGGAFQPEFMAPLANLTVPVGRDAVFTCLVERLGGYRVGWVKADTKAIQAIHDHVITHNPRVSVSHGDHSTWSLHIKGVQMEDAGLYMCQINTDPMKSQTGMLSIEVPPDFIPGETSGDVTVPEGFQVKLKCRASGVPPPQVSWRREDQRDIIIREPFPKKSLNQNKKFQGKFQEISVREFKGEELWLTKITRSQMGVYLCIANNSVPPSISKRIIVDVHFPPAIVVPNQLVGAPLGTDVVLECFVEASPQSINYWLSNNGAMIISGSHHDVEFVTKSSKGSYSTHPNLNFKVTMILRIRNFTKQDVGTYRCAAKNSGGDAESSIRLYDITGPTYSQTANDPVIYVGERDREEEKKEDEIYRVEIDRAENRPLLIDNTVKGHIGSIQPSTTFSNTKPKKRPDGSASSSSSSTVRSDGTATFVKIAIFVVANVSFR